MDQHASDTGMDRQGTPLVWYESDQPAPDGLSGRTAPQDGAPPSQLLPSYVGNLTFDALRERDAQNTLRADEADQ
jgi:hypothetical protein